MLNDSWITSYSKDSVIIWIALMIETFIIQNNRRRTNTETHESSHFFYIYFYSWSFFWNWINEMNVIELWIIFSLCANKLFVIRIHFGTYYTGERDWIYRWWYLNILFKFFKFNRNIEIFWSIPIKLKKSWLFYGFIQIIKTLNFFFGCLNYLFPIFNKCFIIYSPLRSFNIFVNTL